MNPRNVIQLREHQEERVRLPSLDAAYLAGAREASVAVAPDAENGHWRVRPSAKVGVINTPNIQVAIMPKVPMHNVLALMDCESPLHKWSKESFHYSPTVDLLELTIQAFARSLQAALAQGLRRDYVETSERLQAVRGQIDVRELIRRPTQVSTVPCTYASYTLDNELNRLLVAAVNKALRTPSINVRDTATLLAAGAKLEEVSRVPAPDAWLDSWHPTRLDEHFEEAARLAGFLLKNLSLRFHVGGNSAPAFLVDMNALVEQFVSRRLQQLLSGQLAVETQFRSHFDIDNLVPVRPDLLFTRHGQPLHVADLKYKVTQDLEDVKQADLYQAYSYARVTGVESASLIHCGVGSRPTERLRVKNGGSVYLISLDLSGRLSDLAAELERVAEELLSVASPSAVAGSTSL